MESSLPHPIAYRFVDTLSGAAPSSARPLAAEADLLGALDTSALKPTVYRLAAPEMEGRGRGCPGNAKARAHIVSRLREAGLSPLFRGEFEQATFSGHGDGSPYAVNVGAYLATAAPTDSWIVLVAHYDHLGVRRGKVYPGADDNASAVAMLLALGDALAKVRPVLRHHVVLLFPDAEEPPNIRTDRMGSGWFWRHPPFPLARLSCALIFDLLAGRATPSVHEAGLVDMLFVLGAESSPGLARLAGSISPEAGMEPLLLGLPLIEALPFVPWRRFARSDYHGLREDNNRPFLFITGGRTSTYHSTADTPDTMDYAKLARLTRWIARLLVHAAEDSGDLGWTDLVADPSADAYAALRLYATLGDGAQFSWLLRRALFADRTRVRTLLRGWRAGGAPTAAEYRELILIALRLQAALWDPRGWWFALW